MGKQLLGESDASQSAAFDTAVPVGPIVFLEEEAEIFKRLVSSPGTGTEIVPEDIDANDLWRYLTLTAKVIAKTAQAQAKLKPLFGRQLILVKERPEVFTKYGYMSWNDFMTNGVPRLLGISRPEAYNCVKIAETLTFLSTEKMETYGVSKLNVLATAIRRTTTAGMAVEMVERKRAEWVQAADECTVQQLKEKLEQENIIEKGELELVALVLYVNPETKKYYASFKAKPEIRAVIGGDGDDLLLRRLIEECETEWLAQINDSERR